MIHRLAFIVALCFAPLAFSQPEPTPVLTDRPDATPGEILGATYTSLSAGLSFRAPGDCKELHHPGTDEIVSFVNEKRRWVLRVSILSLPSPMPISTTMEEQKETLGVLQMTANNLKLEAPGAEILRQEAFDSAKFDPKYGVIVARYTLGTESNLSQQAFFQSAKDQYFVFNLTTSAPKTANMNEDANVKLAAETFSQMLDTVKLLDQSKLREDQTERLFRTRSFLLNLIEPELRKHLVAEQWLRVIRNGKDVGYSYVVEEVAHDIPRHNVNPNAQGGKEGILVGVRSRTVPDAGAEVNAESWMFCSFDRRNETWSGFAITADATNTKSVVSESGASVKRGKPVVVKPPAGQLPTGEQPDIELQDDYKLEVTQSAKNVSPKPIMRKLPPWYLPQALGHMLPRLLPKFEAKSYLFATYVSERKEVMMRYVEVERLHEVELNGQKMRAITIKDRIGLEGSVTTHYISPEGKYLGSVNPDTKITVLPTDQATLEKLWKNIDLTRPKEVDEKR